MSSTLTMRSVWIAPGSIDNALLTASRSTGGGSGPTRTAMPDALRGATAARAVGRLGSVIIPIPRDKFRDAVFDLGVWPEIDIAHALLRNRVDLDPGQQDGGLIVFEPRLPVASRFRGRDRSRFAQLRRSSRRTVRPVRRA